MKRQQTIVLCAMVGAVLSAARVASAAECVAVGVLEQTANRYSQAIAVSEDGAWVVGNSRKTNTGGTVVIWPFYWSKTGGMQDMGNPGGSNSYVTGCAALGDGSLVACGNIGGLARKWAGGSWSVLPGQGGGARSVYCISHDTLSEETWIGGSSFTPTTENEKAYRYKWSNNSYIDFWGYYQDAYGIAHNGWAAGKNNWGNGSSNPDWAFDHPMFIFDWTYSCAGGGLCGWDQLPRFADYGEDQFFQGQATAISPSGNWVVGYLTYKPGDLSLYHAFKWPVPANPQLNPEPWRTWPRPIDLGALSGDGLSYAYCVSDDAADPVIGGTSNGSHRYGGLKAVYWDSGGTYDLYVLLQGMGVDMSRWSSLDKVQGISANGRVLVGYGYYDDDNDSGTPAIQMGFVADLYFVGPPVIVEPPQPVSICLGGTTTFAVTAGGAKPLTYRWQKGGLDLTEGGHYSGVTTRTLTVSSVDSGDAGNYRCIVMNTYGSTNSSEAALTTVYDPPPTPSDGVPVAGAVDRITWKWTDVSGEGGYRVKDAVGVTKSGDLAADTTQWQEVGLAANTQYTRKVYSFSGAACESVGSAGQSRYTLASSPIYGTGTTSPTVSSTQGPSCSNVAPNSSIVFTATNGFGAGANRAGQFGYLWDQVAGNPSDWSAEQFWTEGPLEVLTGLAGSWYLHLRAYNDDSPKALNSTVLNLGPYAVGEIAPCLENSGFENGFTNGVGNYWAKYVYSGSLDNLHCADETVGPYSGAHCLKIYASSNATDGGVYQQFATTPGQQYSVSAYMKGSAVNVVEVLVAWDLSGGTDPKGATVSSWFGRTATTWGRKGPYTVTATGSRTTVFLRGHNPTSSAAWSVWFDDVQPACGVLSAPTDGTPVAISTTSIRWMWGLVTGATGYRVKDAGGVNLSGDLAAGTSQWEETTGISPNTRYTRRIYAFDAGGESPPSIGQSRYSLIETPTGVSFGTVATDSIVVIPVGTLSNLAIGNSGVRTSNTTAGSDSGWESGQDGWTSFDLTANTPYTFVARARNGDGTETADCPFATKWTLSVPPASSSVTASDPSPGPNESVVWTAAGGFGAGTVQYYRYAWDTSASHTWTGFESQWSTGTLSTTPTSYGTWYLHVRGYNGEDAANGTYDYAVTVRAAADLDTDGDVDLNDFSTFQYCFNGPNRPPTQPACGIADFDGDSDVDLNDFSVFQGCFNGPNRLPACP